MSTGLSHNSALCVTQTQDGYIWIGTRDGICRFDGISYKVFKQNFDDKNSISNNSINCLFEASDGDLWIGTTMGLNRYSHNGNFFKKYLIQDDGKGLSHNYIRCISETGDGKILIGSPSGIDIFDPKNNSFEKIKINKRRDGKENSITCFLKGTKEQIWVGTRSGLYLYKAGELKKRDISCRSNFNLDEIEIRDIKEDSNGKLWVATEEYGLFNLRITATIPELSDNYTVENSNIISNHIRKIFIRKNEIWLGTMEGLSILNQPKQTFSNYKYSANNPEGLSNNSIRDIFGDNQGGIWLATYAGGINYVHEQNNLFPHIKMSTSEDNFLTANVISGFLEEDDGDLWIATEGGGLVYREILKQKTTNYLFNQNKNSLVHNNIKSMTHDNKGNIWVGTYDGLSFFDKKTKIFTNFKNQPNNNNSLINNQVHSVFVDKTNLLWIGTNGGGLETFDPETKIFTSVTEVKVKNVNVMMADHQNRLWIGHQDGLACIDRSSLKKIDLSSLLKQLPFTVQYVQSLYEDLHGRVWIGTQGFGLFILEKEKLVWFNTDKGLPDNTINGILEDGTGSFWISTNKGLSKIRYVESDGSTPKLVVKTYIKGQGLQGLQYSPMCTLKAKSGEFYFGGVNGYNKFNPNEIVDKDFFPPLILTDLRIRLNNKEGVTHWPLRELRNGEKEIKLGYQFRDISVDFLGLNFIDPHHTFYRYRLINIDNNWIDIGTQHTLNFNYLPAGKYELRLQASTNHDIWDSSFQSMAFTILPPWWLTGWAFTLYLLIFILLLALFSKLSQRWVTLNNELAMEHFQREKEEELHQMKLKFFTDISHELRTPLTLIVAPLEQIIKQPDLNSLLKNQLTHIQQNGNRMMRLINKVLDIRRLDAGSEKLQASPGDVVKFLKETSHAFKETANIKNIEFEFETEENSLELYFDYDKMEMILYNLLSNAIKNTARDGHITLNLKLTDTELPFNMKNDLTGKVNYAAISVTDNGRGIPGELLNRIFERFFVSSSNKERFPLDSGVGLELTKRLVELHKGHIIVESKEQSTDKPGFTRFTIFLPLGRDHLPEDEMITGTINREGSSLFDRSMVSDAILDDSSWITAEAEDLSLKSNQADDKLRLLIVEDNSEVRIFIRTLFSGHYLVDEAENGLEGLEKAIEHIPDLIICDIMMPEMDGMELCKRVKTDVRVSHIPVIMLTARTAVTFKYEGLETGADDYITKPFSADYLILRVRNLIRQRETLRNHFTMEVICDPAKITVTSVDEKLLKKAVDYIGDHMSDSCLSVEKLSSELGLSRVHLYRKIKALTNLTAVEFIRSIRIKRAAWLLQENKMNVNEVCAMVGFDDVDYFRNCFRQQFGTSPSEYAKKHKTTTTN